MRACCVIEINPTLSLPQEVAERAIALPLRHCELEEPDKSFCIPIVGGCPSSTHRLMNAFFQQLLAGHCRSILPTLITMEDRSWHGEGDHLERAHDQFCWHAIIEGERQ